VSTKSTAAQSLAVIMTDPHSRLKSRGDDANHIKRISSSLQVARGYLDISKLGPRDFQHAADILRIADSPPALEICFCRAGQNITQLELASTRRAESERETVERPTAHLSALMTLLLAAGYVIREAPIMELRKEIVPG